MLSSWAFLGSSLWKCIWQISTDCCFVPFSIIGMTAEDNWTSLFTCVFYFLCYIKSISLSVTASCDILLEAFLSDSEEESCFWVGRLRLINYCVICLCLFLNHLSESKLNCLILFLLMFQMFILHKWYCPNIFPTAYHSDCYHIIK